MCVGFISQALLMLAITVIENTSEQVWCVCYHCEVFYFDNITVMTNELLETEQPFSLLRSHQINGRCI